MGGVSVWERLSWKNKDRQTGRNDESFLHMLFSCVNGRKAALGSRVASERAHIYKRLAAPTPLTHVNIIIITEHSKMENGSNLRAWERSVCAREKTQVRLREYVYISESKRERGTERAPLEKRGQQKKQNGCRKRSLA